MNELIENAKNDFLQAKGGLLFALSNTPDDRLNWSPSTTARSVLHQVVHAAESVSNIHGSLDGRTFAVPTPAEADRGFREHEKEFTTRDAAIQLLESHSDAFLNWLDGLDPAKLDTVASMAFGLTAPMRVAITFPALHTRWHHAQIDYIQTVYGDLDWHFAV